MNIDDDLYCLCGKHFMRASAAANHRRSCPRAKRKISAVLDRAKTAWEGRQPKKQKRAPDAGPSSSDLSSLETPQRRRVISPSTSNLATQGYENGEECNPELNNTFTQPESEAQIPSVTDSANEDLDLPLAHRRARREKKLPGRLKDYLPHPPSPLPPTSDFIGFDTQGNGGFSPATSPPAGNGTITPPTEPVPVSSAANKFHFFRRYVLPQAASHTRQMVEDPSDIPLTETSTAQTPEELVAPYPNMSSFLLGEWYWNGSIQKSKHDFENLTRVLQSPDFDIDEIQNTRWKDIDQKLGGSTLPGIGEPEGEKSDGWLCSEITIDIPFHSRIGRGVIPGPKKFQAGTLHYRSIVSVIKNKLSGPGCQLFHMDPHELLWQPSEEPPQRIYGELYTSPAFLREHEKLQKSPPEGGCQRPRVIVGLMFSSDETHLTQFGETKLWPLYMYFGNESKYRRCKPTEHLCEHIAYFTKLPDIVKEFLTSHTGTKGFSPSLIAHCVRELLHAQWEIILDDDFVYVYEHGIVVMCYDGIERRFYPRIFTYSADYKEKTVLAGIRNLGLCPCPRCLIPMKEIENLGTEEDRAWRNEHPRSDTHEYQKLVNQARKNLYKKNYALDGDYVDGVLKTQSLTPVKTAFSSRLSHLGFDFFRIFAVDQMHEIESGNWKSLFIHLLRILNCHDPKALLHRVDMRYRQIPGFGRDTIRKFKKNVTDMRNLAARDWEDMLQCAIPVFEGLLEEPHNTVILDLLFTLAHWHGLAKLRMHTDSSLALLDQLTNDLGIAFRRFKETTCNAFKTQELPREANARIRKAGSASRKRGQPPLTGLTPAQTPSGVVPSQVESVPVSTSQKAGQPPHTEPASTPSSIIPPGTESASATMPSDKGHSLDGAVPQLAPSDATQPPASTNKTAQGKANSTPGTRQFRFFNMNTYKFHAFGDYADTIRLYGTTDSYSTECGELEHRSLKARYKRTSKKNHIKQLTQIERRQARIRMIRRSLNKKMDLNRHTRQIDPTVVQLAPNEGEPVPAPEKPYALGQTQNDAVFIHEFLHMSAFDPATKGFLSNLKQHLHLRIEAGGGSNNEDPLILFQSDRLYRHRVIRINYTTYDIRRDEDVLNPNTSNCNIMMVRERCNSEEGLSHPFLYARILGIFHVNVLFAGGGTDHNGKRMDVLWVRWYENLPPKGPRRLHRLKFPPVNSDEAFGFVDPKDVLRSCHVTPSLADDKASVPSSASEWRGRERVTFYNVEQLTLTERLSLKTTGISKLAQEEDQWNVYYVNPFVDRDMLMRFHWRMAVGHLYDNILPFQDYNFYSAYDCLPEHSNNSTSTNSRDDVERQTSSSLPIQVDPGPAIIPETSDRRVVEAMESTNGAASVAECSESAGLRSLCFTDKDAVSLFHGTFNLQDREDEGVNDLEGQETDSDKDSSGSEGDLDQSDSGD